MPMFTSSRAGRVSGFTLIELVLIIVVMTILGIVVLTRYQPAELSVSVEADRLGRDIRHMQMLAMTWGQPLRLSAAGNTYSVSCASASVTPPCNGASPVIDPSSGVIFTRTLQAGVTFGTGVSFDFDALGRPGTWSAGPTFTLSLNPGPAMVVVSFTLSAGSETSVVSILELTGFVSVVY